MLASCAECWRRPELLVTSETMATPRTQCQVCRVNYNSSEHRPKILPCSHTVCKLCTQELIAQISAACPQCDRKLDRHDVLAITTDFAALELSLHSGEKPIPSEDLSCTGSGSRSPRCDSDLTPTQGSAENELAAEMARCQHGQAGGEDEEERDSPVQLLTEDLMLKFETAIADSEKVRDALTNQYEKLKMSSQKAVQEMDADFEDVIHLLNRRRQLVRQQLMSQYEEKLSSLDESMETVTLNAMRVDCLRKHSSRLLAECQHDARAALDTAEKAEREILELTEPLRSIDTHVRVFRYETGSDSQTAVKLIRSHGRIKCVVDDPDTVSPGLHGNS